MTANTVARAFLLAFAAAFFLYLFGPLLVMGITAFNSSAFPRVTPFECFSVEWFGVLAADEKLMRGLGNSIVIGFGVVFLAVPVGLAGALLLTQVPDRTRPWYYTVVISPILIPGVVLGISTLVFWDRLGRMFGAGEASLFYNGIFLTIVGQTTFVAAYCMLIFIARLQRFDGAQEEAARDLGATPWQSFRKVLLPFLRPAVGSAAVLAFLASFENYNTTVFTSLTSETLVTVLASKVRYGINPSISALAVLIVALTLAGACLFEIVKRREANAAKDGPQGRAPKAAQVLNPALAVFVLICIAGVGTVYLAGTLGVDECKRTVQTEKQERTRTRIEALRRTRQPGRASTQPPPAQQDDAPRVGEVPNIFLPEQNATPTEPPTDAERTPDEPREAPDDANRPTNPFAPENLAPGGQQGTRS